MTEKTVQKKIREWLTSHGAFVLKYHGGIHSYAGHSDLYGVLPGGRFFAIEVKKTKKKPRPNQLTFLETVRRHGGVAFWADSFEKAVEELSTVGVVDEHRTVGVK